MKRTYYLFNPGRVSRTDNTLKFVPSNENGQTAPAKYLPIEDIESLYIFGSIDMNSALMNFLGNQHIPIHFFDYYEHYTGSFQPKDYLLAGKVQIEQTKAYIELNQRLYLAQRILEGGAHNMLQNVKYYNRRERDLEDAILSMQTFKKMIPETKTVGELMGIEGNIRQVYYSCFEEIIVHFEMNGRQKQPPSNEVNALISFGNMMCYSLVLDMIYHTQLNPTISFLHEPGTRRYSLALDLAEVFKPVLVDRCIFKLLNKKILQSQHFDKQLNGCWLNNSGKQIFIQNFEETLKETIHHKTLNRSVSYKRLVLLECYKIAKYILKVEDNYQPFLLNN